MTQNLHWRDIHGSGCDYDIVISSNHDLITLYSNYYDGFDWLSIARFCQNYGRQRKLLRPRLVIYTFNFCSLAFLSRKEILLLNPFCLCEGCFEVNYLGCIFFFSSWKCILSIKLAILLEPRWAGLWFVTGIGQLE